MPPKKTPLAENKYLTDDALRATVAEAIARLELDRHQIRLAVLMHGEGVQVSEGESADESIERITDSIAKIEAEYANVLAVD